MDVNLLQLTEFVLQDNEIARMYRFIGGSPNLDGLELTVTLSNNDLNVIKATQGLATSIGDTYLVITSSDISGNPIKEISNCNA